MYTIEECDSGLELAKRRGVHRDEGVVVAVFPDVVTGFDGIDTPIRDAKHRCCAGILVHSAEWGTRLMDLVSPGRDPMKWWKVQGHRELPQVVPVSWAGPIEDIPTRFFDGAPLGVRLYADGPWIFVNKEPEVKR